MNLPPLPELPEQSAWIVGSSLEWLADPARTPRAYTYAEITRLNYDGERTAIFTADQLRAYALAYGELVRHEHLKIRQQDMQDWHEQIAAAAIRNGVIREGEGE